MTFLVFSTILLLVILILYHTNYVKCTNVRIKTHKGIKCRIIQISDLHGKRVFINGTLSNIINKYSPDIVCITGDLTNKRSQIPKIYEEISKIKSSHILFVPGNYEREEYISLKKRKLSEVEYRQTIDKLKGTMHVLENQFYKIKNNQSELLVYGFDNSIYGNEKYICQIEKEQRIYKVLLAHSPSIINVINREKIDYDLLLVGHTHGGQIRLGKWTLSNSRYRNFHLGMENDDDKCFYINRGLGTARLPFRINCFPEITIFNLE